MAIYHCTANQISRSGGRSSIASAAYRSGEKLLDIKSGLTHNFENKKGVDHTEILAPKNAPNWATDRQTLWNQVEASEKRKDANLCREVEVALPRELSLEQKIELTRDFAQQFVHQGMIADLAIHHANGDNPHAHILLTTREITPDGFGLKNRDWFPPPSTNGHEYIHRLRETWQNTANEHLNIAGLKTRIDCRSLAEQGIERQPQIHLGANVLAMEEKGIVTDRGDQFRQIEKENLQIKSLTQELKANERVHEITAGQEPGRIGREFSAPDIGLGDRGRRDEPGDSREPEASQRIENDLIRIESDASRLLDRFDLMQGTNRSPSKELGTERKPNEKAGSQSIQHTVQDQLRRGLSGRGLGILAAVSNEKHHEPGGSNDSADESRNSLEPGTSPGWAGFDRGDTERRDITGDKNPIIEFGLSVGRTFRAAHDRYKAFERHIHALKSELLQVFVFKPLGSLFEQHPSYTFPINKDQLRTAWNQLDREQAKGHGFTVQPIHPGMTAKQVDQRLYLSNLSEFQLKQLQKSGLEPCAITEDLRSYSAWINLAEHPLRSDVAERLNNDLTVRFDCGEPSRSGSLAGFRSVSGSTIQLVDASGRIASQGSNWIQRTELTLDKEAHDEKWNDIGQQRLDKILMTPDKKATTLVGEYQRQMHRLHERYGDKFNAAIADKAVCKDLAKRGYSESDIRQTLNQASPEQAWQKARDNDHYAHKTAEAAEHDKSVREYRKQEKQQEKEINKTQSDMAKTKAFDKELDITSLF